MFSRFIFCLRFNPFDDGDLEQPVRDSAPISLNLQDYTQAVRSNLYGGDLEIATLAWLFKLKVSVYSHYQWKGSCDKLCPEVHVQDSEADNPDGGSIYILHECGLSGASDHFSLIVPSRTASSEFDLSDSDDDSDDCPKRSLFTPPAPSPPVVAPKRGQKHALKEAAPSAPVDVLEPRGQSTRTCSLAHSHAHAHSHNHAQHAHAHACLHTHACAHACARYHLLTL